MKLADLCRLLGETRQDASGALPAPVVETLDRLLGSKTLTEGTVIVLNSDEPGQQDALKQALAQLSAKGPTTAPSAGPVTVPTHERFQLETGGKVWKFKVNRDPNGVITDLDVVEPT